jgi:hypothetical protein
MIKKHLKTFACLSLLSISLVSCTSKSALSVFGEDSLYERGLEYTKVADIINSLETKAIINITYLNSSHSKKWDNKNQNFLIGIYIVNDNEKDRDKYLNNNKYQLTLNNTNITSSVELNSTNDLWEHIPIKNPHAKYYVTTFDKNDSIKTLSLNYKHTTFGGVTLLFASE